MVHSSSGRLRDETTSIKMSNPQALIDPESSTTDIYKYISTYDFSSDLEFRTGLGTILGHPGQPASDNELLNGGDVVLQAKCFFISRLVTPGKPNRKKISMQGICICGGTCITISFSSENLMAVLMVKSRKQNITPSIDYMTYKDWLKENGLASENNVTTNQISAQASNKNNTTDSQRSEDAHSSTVDDNNPYSAVATSSSPKSASLQENKMKEESKDAEPAYPSSFAHIVELITNNQPIPGIEDIPDTILTGHDEPSKATRRRKPWEKENEEVSDDNSLQSAT